MTAHISEDGLSREESVAEHTEKTAYLCRKKGKRCGLAQVMALCGILHDMGKNKQKFDDYIHADEKIRQKLRGTIAHAPAGAKYIYDQHHDDAGNAKILTELISYTVAAHHGMFDCVDIEHRDVFSEKQNNVDDYEEAYTNAKNDYLDKYKPENIFSEASDEFNLVWSKMKGLLERLKPSLKKENYKKCRSYLLACLQRLMLSIMIDADWEAASDFMDNIDTLSKQVDNDAMGIFRKAEENFQNYMQKKQQSVDFDVLTDKEKEIFKARNALQNECRKFAKHQTGIYCLPIPTGGGKTLSSLAYALEYCKQHTETERVIYVSPYISITEQNAEVFRRAVGNEEWILEHHSSVIRNEEKEDEDYRRNKFSKLDMNWEEPFICTTFVQFMNTLFSDKSESVRRMHRLVNSVVIIDEVQSMPLKCIHTFNYMINFLNAVCNTNIILCTATQPALEDAECPICYSEPKYMIKDARDWFVRFERVKVHLPETGQKYTFESLANEVARQSEKYQSILIILNTKSAVRKLYDILKAQNVNAVYLTTNLCAEHRSDRIAAVKEKLVDKHENIVVVSTNLIEAGVDISFECVYRSMTGLDSLAQSAGRCNRNGEMEYGIVNLIVLEGENTGSMEELKQNVRVSEQLIYEYGKSSMEDSLLMPAWIDKYYKKVYSYASDKMNFPIKKLDTSVMELLSKGYGAETTKNFMNQAYKTAGQAYKVIDDDSFGVIVPYKEGTEIIKSIQESSDLAELKKYVRRAQRYTVNVRGSQLRNFDGLIQPVSGKIPDLYMIAASGAYKEDCGITAEWETLIF